MKFVLALFVGLALFADVIAGDRPLLATKHFTVWPLVRFSPLTSDPALGLPPPTPPDSRHWLGTDDRGRDCFARLVFGLRTSLLFGLGCWLGAAFFGYAVGLVQGSFGGLVDLLLQRFVEVFGALPFLHVVLCLNCVFRPSLSLLMVTWVAFGWIPFAAYARAEALRTRRQPFALAARAAGVRRSRLLWRHLLPHTLTPLWAVSPLWLGSCIASLTALDFLGFGLPPPTPSWGELLRQSRDNPDGWWLVVFPLATLTLLVASCFALGERARRARAHAA